MFAKNSPMTDIKKPHFKILLVEDNDLFRSSLSDLLETLGYEVLALPDGLEFLKYVDEYNPNLILLDLHLPFLDGFALMEQWQTSPYSQIPILMLSASELAEERRRALALGARQFLPKSITMQDLDLAIRSALNDESLD